MTRKLLVLAAAASALALAGTASAADNGANVVTDQSCTATWYGTVCADVKTTTNTTTTPSGNLSYVTNGTIERTLTFWFGGTYTTNEEIHVHNLLKDGAFAESSDHYARTWESVSGTYHLSCSESYDIHWTSGAAQFGDYALECNVL